MLAALQNPYDYCRALVTPHTTGADERRPVPCSDAACRGLLRPVGRSVPVHKGQMLRSTYRCDVCGVISVTVAG